MAPFLYRGWSGRGGGKRGFSQPNAGFRAKAPDLTSKNVDHNRYLELSNRVGAEFQMRNRFKARIQAGLLAQPFGVFWKEYQSDISCHPFGSSRSMRNAEKVGPEIGDANGLDESSDGSSNSSIESEDQEEDEDKDFEAWW